MTMVRKNRITESRKPSVAVGMDFAALVSAIRQVHEHCAGQAKRAVNVNLTLRNWVIGVYIAEYELHGKDRAKYGERLIDSLSAELKRHRVPTCDCPRLYAYIAFFRTYPQIGAAMQDNPIVAETPSILRSLTGQSGTTGKRGIVRSVTGEFDLKVDEFRHEHIGQLNTYVTWYRKQMMAENDNPPVGLLLCTGKDHAFVEYALAAMDNRLFVSKYQLELPSKDDLRNFIAGKRVALGEAP